MNALLAIPIELRLVALFLIGVVVASGLNLAIYRLAWNRRLISPWSPAPDGAPRRRLLDRVPIIGWLGLRRETPWLGRGFWIRPMLLELSVGLGSAALYWWEIEQQALFQPLLIGAKIAPDVLHLQYLSHVLLISLMLVASLIDIDEKLIPDAITVTGTLLGLALAAIVPWSLLPHVDFINFPAPPPPMSRTIAVVGGGTWYHQFLMASSPDRLWPSNLAGAPQGISLIIALGCYWLWCFAILPRPWYPRHGWRRALRIASARLGRALSHPVSIAKIVLGSAAIGAVWWRGGESWAGLLTALIGLAASGGIIWAVRIIGAVTLRKEAMGFGDVTLMMMIGTFLGWQPCLMIFFLAPFAGLIVGIIQFIAHRDQVIPYGPFLCLASLAMIVLWADIWIVAQGVFGAGWLVPAAFALCLLAMGVILLLMRLIRERLSNY